MKLTLVASLATFLASCGPDPRAIRRCVDNNNRVADDWFCDDRNPQHAAASGAYHFYYGGPTGFIPVGSAVSGGSTTPPAGITNFSSPTARGVLGGAGEAHGAGAGDGAGE